MDNNKIKNSQSKDSWSSVRSDSPLQGARKKSDWRFSRSVFDDKTNLDARKGQLAAIREGPGPMPAGTLKSKVYNDSTMAVQSNRTRDFADLDSILSEIGGISSKKDTRCRLIANIHYTV